MSGHDPPDTGPPSDGEQTANTREVRAGGGEAGERTIGQEVAETTGRRNVTDEMECTSDAVASTGNAREESPGSANLPTWRDKLKAQAPKEEVVTEEHAKGSRMLEGIWNPVHVKMLLNTLMTNWEETPNVHMNPDHMAMRKEALAPANASCDESIRSGTARENEIMKAYMAGDLELPHPPNFLKEVMISAHRALMEDMHEEYMNSTLTAVVPATVRVGANAPHADLYKELFVANTDKSTGHSMMRALQRDVKRLSFDGGHTLLFVFYSKSAAARWNQKALRYQNAVIVLHNTHRRPEDEGTGQYTAAQVEVQYAVRIYGAGRLGLAALERAFSLFSEAEVLDVEYARAKKTEIYDNRYHTIRFAQTTCPEPLRGVTRIKMDKTMITLHHFQQFLRRPCACCLSARHGAKRCTMEAGRVEEARARVTRIYRGSVVIQPAAARMKPQVSSLDELIHVLAGHAQPPAEPASLLPMELTPSAQLFAVGHTSSSTEAKREGSDHYEQQQLQHAPDAEGFVTKQNKHSKNKTASRRSPPQRGITRNQRPTDSATSYKRSLKPQRQLCHPSANRNRRNKPP